jgi:outer membrane immunogenic protein
MVYAKGGWASATFQVDARNLATGVAPFAPIDFTRDGWTAGGGVTWMFSPQWSAFFEYNRYEFANRNFFTGAQPLGFGTLTTTLDLKSTIHTATIGVNYKFLPIP